MALSKLWLSDKTPPGGAGNTRPTCFHTTEQVLSHHTQIVGTHLLDSPSSGIWPVSDVATFRVELFRVQAVWVGGGRLKGHGVEAETRGLRKSSWMCVSEGQQIRRCTCLFQPAEFI